MPGSPPDRWPWSSPAVLALVLDALADTEDWIDGHRADAAALLAEHVPGDVTADAWRRRLQSRRWGLRPVSASFLGQQQRAADLLAEHRALPRRVGVSKAMIACQVTRQRRGGLRAG